MKVVLTSAPFNDEWRLETPGKNDGYPLGIPYLHSYLESHGHEVHSLVNNHGELESYFHKVYESLREFNPDVVGLNFLSDNRSNSFKLIEYIRKNHSGVRIIIGGVHATTMFEQIVRKYPGIVAVLGEGELTSAELLKYFESGAPLNAVNGIAFMDQNGADDAGKVVRTPPRELIKELDKLPFPHHDIFFHGGRTSAHILTSRGCPFLCTFCVTDASWRRKIRFRSVESIISEIEHLMETYPQLDSIFFADDLFTINMNRVIAFCDEIVRRKIKLQFRCMTRFKPMSQEMINAMARAGFVTVYFGLETASPKLLESSRKGITQDAILQSWEKMKHSKLEFSVFLIVGLYGETRETIRETVQFIQKMQSIRYVSFCNPNILIVYPGSGIYDIAKEYGLLDDDYWLTDKHSPYFTCEHSLETLRDFSEELFDSISINRFFTYAGFRNQWMMIPAIIKANLAGQLDLARIIGGAIRSRNLRLYTMLKWVYMRLRRA
ncbi:MAG: B12-binding domain-containing radical SAM protein [Magnetococcales bacterium]|nr:B12-binding domain-containing radical SAM protein [Magnetococcales bacterium]